MLTETYPVSWLAPRTVPATFAVAARWRGAVRVTVLSLVKGVIRTPMVNGKVDYESVPVGASIWVTVTDESSPLHGRPILITKRPDGQFALEGGSGVGHWHADPERERRIASRRHLVLNAGKVRATTADKALQGKLAERDAKRAQLSEERRAGRVARREAARESRAAFGLPKDVVFTRAENERHRDRVRELFIQQGASADDAKKFATAIVRDMNTLTKRYYAYFHARRAAAARDVAGGPMLEMADPSEAQPATEAAAVDQAHEFHLDLDALVKEILDKDKKKKEKKAKGLTEQEAEVVAQQAGEQQLGAALAAVDAPAASSDAAPAVADLAESAPSAEALPEAPPERAPEAPEPASEFVNDAVTGSDDAVDFAAPAAPGAVPPPPPPPVRPNNLVLAKVNDWQVGNPAEAGKALDAFRREQAARLNATALQQDLKQYEGLRLISPTAVDRQSLTAAPVGDAEGDRLLDDMLEHYRRMGDVPSEGRFYEAIGDHWNDEIPYADGIGEFAAKGAVSAVVGILGDAGMLDARIDVAKLVRDLGIEGAAYALAGDIIATHGKEAATTAAGAKVNKVDDIIRKLTDHNSRNQKATEDRALQRHAELQRQAALIDRALETGELAIEPPAEGETRPDVKVAPNALVRAIQMRANAEGTRLLCDNINAQRENLGTALGSMQMAATLLHALDVTAKNARKGDPEAKFVTLFYGDNKEARNEAMKAFRLPQGAMVADHDLRMGHALRIDTTRLRRYVGRVKADHVRNLDWERTKRSEQGVQEVGGQEVVPDYKVPFFKSTFTDVDGEEKPAYLRRNQRNDIEWLRKAGGGVITRTTGAGKTNTTLGFYAHQIAANPHYHGAVVVPKGRAEQWAKEAATFTTLPIHQVPDNATPAQVDEHLRDYAASGGGVLLLSHRLAGRHHEALQRMYEAGKLHGLTIDEPQELMGASKQAKLTGGAQQVLKVGTRYETVATKKGGTRVVATPDPTFNRVALTATPAKREPVQAYDLVNWTNPQALGPRTKFRAAFTGFNSGTNAADSALARMVGREIAPFVSGDESVANPFELRVEEHLVNRTPAQVERQRQIEAEAPADLLRLTQAKYESLRRQPTNKNRSRADLQKEAQAFARETIAQRHRQNLDAGELMTDEKGNERLADPAQAAQENAKIQALLQRIRTSQPGEKHVIFVDGKHQRAAVTAGLRQEGYSPNAIKNITGEAGPDEVAARKAAWKAGGKDVPFLLIDRQSASGHNLQEGDHLHVLAAPDDAAQLLQAQGRVARGNKRTDTIIHTYKTHDSPFETRKWEAIDSGMKLMAATSPGLARKFVSRVVKARDAALREYAARDADREQDAAK